MDNTLLLIIVAAVTAAIGYFAGIFINLRRTPKEDAPASDPLPAPAAGKEAPAPAPATAPPAPPARNRLDMAAFWREMPSGVLRADLDGKTFKTGAELSVEQRRRLQNLSNDLSPWLIPPEGAVPAQAESPRLAELAPLPLIQLPADSIPAAEKSIVAQIDDIFQERIAGTPLDTRGIRLVELPGHGVAVRVGIQQYPSIDEVPDAEIAAALRAAVKTWENRAG
jgi:hypothetical protein